MGLEPYVFHAQFTPDRVGLWTFRVDGWGDPVHTWRHGVIAKLDAGQGEKELAKGNEQSVPHRARRREALLRCGVERLTEERSSGKHIASLRKKEVDGCAGRIHSSI